MTATLTTGPLERALLEEVEDQLRQHGIVFWLDKSGHYTGLVDRMAKARAAGELAYPVVPVRGSYLEAMLALEPYGSELQRERLLVHMPGHDESSVRATPLLELYEMGTRYRKSLKALVEQAATGTLAPSDVRELAGRADLTLELAETVLAERLGARSEGLDKTFERLDVAQVIESVLGMSGLVMSVRTPADFAALRAYLHRQTGYEAAWAERTVGPETPGTPESAREHLRKALGAWLLLLEFVHDLERAPKTPTLVALQSVPPELVKRCRALVVHMRTRHPEAYAQLANELEGLVDEEIKDVTAAELGRIDTFAFEERIVLEGAIRALKQQDWPRVLAWAKDRAGEASFWLGRDRKRRWAWMLAEEAAELGRAVDASQRPLESSKTLHDAVDRYRTDAYRVDRAHRQFEQRWHELRDPQLPHWDDLLDIVEIVRRHYRGWADRLARDFSAICVREGFLPDAALQQRTLFDQVVKPLAQEGETVAVFVIDALRYEMAEGIAEEMRQTSGVSVDLRARLAELPTLTAVGMNALAPVAREGRLDAVMTAAGAFRGFKTSSFAVVDPETRARAMGASAIGEPARLVKLVDVVDAPARRLTDWVKKGPRLIVVHGLEIDDAGEAGFGLATFEQTLRHIRAAWHHLSVAGVKTFVLTADHGFLLQDATTTVQPYGKKTDPSRRHVWSANEVREDGMVPVSLAKLGYDGAPGYVLFREDTAVYATAGAGSVFVHGGNSLEERVIPVLVVKRKRGPGQSGSSYVVEAQQGKALMGTQRVRLRVQLASDVSGSLAFASAQSIRLSIEVRDRENVTLRLRECDGPARLRGGAIDVDVGPEWTDVFFVLEGAVDDRVQLEIRHPDRTEQVQPAVVQEYFTVTGVAAAAVATTTRSDRPPSAKAPAAAAPVAGDWRDAIADEDFRAVFEHIGKHGSINEGELIARLGGRKARNFARQYEDMIKNLPFGVRIETAGMQKVYVKDGGR
jgi:hypothetical protein